MENTGTPPFYARGICEIDAVVCGAITSLQRKYLLIRNAPSSDDACKEGHNEAMEITDRAILGYHRRTVVREDLVLTKDTYGKVEDKSIMMKRGPVGG